MTRTVLPSAILLGSLFIVQCGGEPSDSPDGLGGSSADGGQGGAMGEDKCCLLGAICHVVGTAVDPDVDRCHQIGHENDQAVCAEEFDACLHVCDGLSEDPTPHACE